LACLSRRHQPGLLSGPTRNLNFEHRTAPLGSSRRQQCKQQYYHDNSFPSLTQRIEKKQQQQQQQLQRTDARLVSKLVAM